MERECVERTWGPGQRAWKGSGCQCQALGLGETCPRGTRKPGKMSELAPSHLTYLLCLPLAWQLGS